MASQDDINEAIAREHLTARKSELELHQNKLQSLKLEFGSLEDMAKCPERLGENPQIADRLKELPSQIGKEQAAVEHSQIEVSDAQKRLDLQVNKPLPNPAGGPTEDRTLEDRLLYERDQAGAELKKETDERIEKIAHAGEAMEPENEPEHPPEPPKPPEHEPPTQAMQTTPTHYGEVQTPQGAHGPDPLLVGAMAFGAIHAAGKGIGRAIEKSEERKLEAAENLYKEQDKAIDDLQTQLKEQSARAAEEMKKLDLDAKAQSEFQRNEFESAANQMNTLYNDQKQQREDKGVDIPERNAEWQAKWSSTSQALCEDQVRPGVEQRNEQLVKNYAELQPDPAKLENYQQNLQSGQSAQIEQQAQQLQQQTFPQMAPQGPALQGPSQTIQQPQMGGPGGP